MKIREKIELKGKLKKMSKDKLKNLIDKLHEKTKSNNLSKVDSSILKKANLGNALK